MTYESEFVSNDPDGNLLIQGSVQDREMVVRLGPGHRWPDYCKRGRSIDVQIGFGGQERIFRGRVKFRRMVKLVMIGQFVEEYDDDGRRA